MREMQIKEMWKRAEDEILFTNYLMPRKDYDWKLEEIVRIVFRPMGKNRKVIGVARIIRMQPKNIERAYHGYLADPKTSESLTPEDAKEDGFTQAFGYGDVDKMIHYYRMKYGYPRCNHEKLNKITLYWIDNSMIDPITMAETARI